LKDAVEEVNYGFFYLTSSQWYQKGGEIGR